MYVWDCVEFINGILILQKVNSSNVKAICKGKIFRLEGKFRAALFSGRESQLC